MERDDSEYQESRLSISESIASTLLFGLGALTIVRGLYWLTNSHTTADIEMYESLASVLPLWAWSLGFIIGGLLLLLSSWVLPKRVPRRRFFLYLLFGGIVSNMSYFIIAIAGFGNSETWMTPVQLVVFSTVSLVLAFFGGMQLWQTKKGS